MRIAFAGSGSFGIPCLEAVAASRHQVVLAISQPDRPVGRRRIPTPPPAAEAARRLGLPLFQPERLNTVSARDHLAGFAPDLLLVIAYGQILKPKVLALPRFGAINVHGSVLPRHRGASPIAASLLAGDATSGVTVLQMDEGLDSGPILGVVETPILPGETAGELHDRLAALAPRLLLEVLEALENGQSQPVPQDPRQVTHCGLIAKSDGRLDWRWPAAQLERHIRAMTPWPGAQASLQRAQGPELALLIERAHAEEGEGSPGQVHSAERERLSVGTGSGRLVLERLRPAGKGSQTAGEFLRGYHVQAGDRFAAVP